jgi:hypothetical protein
MHTARDFDNAALSQNQFDILSVTLPCPFRAAHSSRCPTTR